MKKWLIILTLLLPVIAGAQRPRIDYVTTPEDRALADKILLELTICAGEEPGKRMARTAEALIGQSYVAGTLEERPEEKLCIYLTRTDCFLFMETCLALVRTTSQGGTFDVFARELLRSRYRGGVCSRYEDRLHYTTEWARQAVSRGVLEDVTEALGGVPYEHPVHYMSDHPDAYPRMKDPEAIAAAERDINARPSAYIPKENLAEALPGIMNGDIILFTTRTEGLDVSHCAIARADPGQPVRFIHASTAAKKVILEPRTLDEYVQERKSVSGIQVYRIR